MVNKLEAPVSSWGKAGTVEVLTPVSSWGKAGTVEVLTPVDAK